MYLLQQQDLYGFIWVWALLKAGQHCLHQFSPVGRQDGHMVPRLIVQLISPTGAEDHLLSPPATPTTTAATDGEGKKGLLNSFDITVFMYKQ